MVTATIGLNIASEKSSEKYIISNNGNFLFYNAPVATKANGYIFISFVTREGLIVVNKYSNPKGIDKIRFLRSYIVHDYSKKIELNGGPADDHSAPAIIYDKINNKLLLATSYHTSDVYLYQYDFEKNIFELHKILKGRYTYPRLINWNNNIYLLLRSMPTDRLAGDLILKSSIDNFNSESTIVSSSTGEIIYASRPTIGNNHLFVSYSILKYSEGRYTNWKIAKFDLKNTTNAVKIFDLDLFVNKGYYSNRPTSIRYKNGTLVVATSIFMDDEANVHFKNKYYNRKNKILIVTINSNDGSFIKRNHDNTVVSPYYHTSIDINSDGDYIYFSKDLVYSSKKFSKTCFENNNLKMYPNFFDQNILYATINNNSYNITDFNNTIVLCTYPLENDKVLYADDDHHSTDGSAIQARYFIKDIINEGDLGDK